MTTLFITIRFLDIVDILLVALFIQQFYRLIRKTTTFNIFAGIFTIYLIWLIVRALNMELVSTILGQLFGVGVIAMIIVFQQEIRKFLLVVGSRYKVYNKISFEQLIFGTKPDKDQYEELSSIASACKEMAIDKTGALIIIKNRSNIDNIEETGTVINANVDKDLLKSIFFKNSPLHDGAIVIDKDKIKSVRCILPITDSKDIDPNLGLRHRAAIGITEQTDVAVIVVSEETGVMSFVAEGEIERHLTHTQIKSRIIDHLDK